MSGVEQICPIACSRNQQIRKPGPFWIRERHCLTAIAILAEVAEKGRPFRPFRKRRGDPMAARCTVRQVDRVELDRCCLANLHVRNIKS